jgi:hypothetical protein
MPHHGFAPHERYMQRLVLVHEFQNAANEFLPAKIAEFPKGSSPA